MYEYTCFTSVSLGIGQMRGVSFTEEKISKMCILQKIMRHGAKNKWFLHAGARAHYYSYIFEFPHTFFVKVTIHSHLTSI